MTALDSDAAPPLDALPGLEDSEQGPPILEGACPYPRYRCAKPIGHPGSHAKAPEDRARQANGTRKRGAPRADRPRPAGSSSAGRRRAGTSTTTVMPGLLGMAWAAIGMQVEHHAPDPIGPPVGRVMQFQYIDAGQILHRVLLGLPVYRKLNAVAGAGGGISDELAALIGGPLLAAVMATNESAKLALWPVFAELIKTSAVSIAKAQHEQLEAMTRVNEYQAEVDAMLDGMQAGLFAPGPNVDKPDKPEPGAADE